MNYSSICDACKLNILIMCCRIWYKYMFKKGQKARRVINTYSDDWMKIINKLAKERAGNIRNDSLPL